LLAVAVLALARWLDGVANFDRARKIADGFIEKWFEGGVVGGDSSCRVTLPSGVGLCNCCCQWIIGMWW